MGRMQQLSWLYRRRFVREGLLGGSRKWLILGGMVFSVHHIRRILSASQTHRVFHQELAPGEKLLISHFTGPEKGRR